MTIRVAINHRTTYKFDRPVAMSPHTVRLRPAPHSRTPIHSYSLKIKPEGHFINWQQDAFGNYLARLVFPDKCTEFEVDVEVIADMTVINPFDFFVEEYAEKFPFEYEGQVKKELLPYLETLEGGPLFKEFLAGVNRKKRPMNDFLVDLNQYVQGDIEYMLRMEPGVQSPEETLETAKGSCRDSAWLLVQLLRHLGLAARFASGYLVQLKPDELSLDGPSGAAEDFTDLHAWCEVFLPGAGWVGLDPTSGLFASEGHIPLACTPHPVSAAPIAGATDKCEVEFSFSNTVERVLEDPRVTKPYTEAQWQHIVALGKAVDKEFEQQDVRLTMGGEPTFVSIDDMESPQWNTEALGEQKLSLAKTLLLRLRDRFAPKGLLHYGQGKWYPGEEVPRWALGVFWRKDGEALWDNHELLARVDQNYGYDNDVAGRFGRYLCDLLTLPRACCQPAFEDGLHYLMQEQMLPKNLDILAQKLKGDLDRRRLARLIERGFGVPSGVVIPLQRSTGWPVVEDQKSWRSSLWPLRRERITLIPGDSPMGLRLPLGELPEIAKKADRVQPQRDPFEPRDPLASRAAMQFADPEKAQDEDIDEPVEYEQVVRTALCVEVRDGRLYVFMPPLEYLEDYVELIAAVEQATAALS